MGKWGFGITCFICKEDFQNVNGLVWHYLNIHHIEPKEPTEKPKGTIRW